MLLDDVPFFPDDSTLCGPSALATVLEHSGVAVTPAELTDAVYLPGLKGSLQAEMLGAVRRQDRVALALPASLEAVTTALEAGYPVLILQRLRMLWKRSWHYAVVVGYEPVADVFLLRSGQERLLRMPRRQFEASWAGAEHWAYVLVRPDSLPAFATRDAFLDGVIGLEAAGRLEAARLGYQLGQRRWPEEQMFAFGYANVLVAEGSLLAAVGTYRCAHERFPEHVPTVNNLAWSLGELGCAEEALRLLDEALERDDLGDRSREQLTSTRREVLENESAAECPVTGREPCS